jgi:hypothetical protein
MKMDAGIGEGRLEPFLDLAADEIPQIHSPAKENQRQDGKRNDRPQSFFSHQQRQLI